MKFEPRKRYYSALSHTPNVRISVYEIQSRGRSHIIAGGKRYELCLVGNIEAFRPMGNGKFSSVVRADQLVIERPVKPGDGDWAKMWLS